MFYVYLIVQRQTEFTIQKSICLTEISYALGGSLLPQSPLPVKFIGRLFISILPSFSNSEIRQSRRCLSL